MLLDTQRDDTDDQSSLCVVQFSNDRRVVAHIETVDCRFLAIPDLTLIHIKVVRHQDVVQPFACPAWYIVSVIFATRFLWLSSAIQ